MFLNKLQLIILLLIILLILLYIFSYKRDEVYYIEDFLSKNDHEYIKNYVKNINNMKNESFRYIKPINDKNIQEIFYSENIINKIESIIDNKIKESNFPIEYRIYPKGSEGMKCHKDTLLYDKPQYEAIFTINNESNSVTQWKDNYGQIHGLWTEPNSLLIVKANGYEHHVTPPVVGEREILKLIYTQSDIVNNNYKKEIKRFK